MSRSHWISLVAMTGLLAPGCGDERPDFDAELCTADSSTPSHLGGFWQLEGEGTRFDCNDPWLDADTLTLESVEIRVFDDDGVLTADPQGLPAGVGFSGRTAGRCATFSTSEDVDGGSMSFDFEGEVIDARTIEGWFDGRGPSGCRSEGTFTIAIDPDGDQDGNPDAVDPDRDDDGLTNVEEVELGTDPDDPDTDDDEVGDASDLCPTTPDPMQRDLDGDGIGLACDDFMTLPEVLAPPAAPVTDIASHGDRLAVAWADAACAADCAVNVATVDVDGTVKMEAFQGDLGAPSIRFGPDGVLYAVLPGRTDGDPVQLSAIADEGAFQLGSLTAMPTWYELPGPRLVAVLDTVLGSSVSLMAGGDQPLALVEGASVVTDLGLSPRLVGDVFYVVTASDEDRRTLQAIKADSGVGTMLTNVQELAILDQAGLELLTCHSDAVDSKTLLATWIDGEQTASRLDDATSCEGFVVVGRAANAIWIARPADGLLLRFDASGAGEHVMASEDLQLGADGAPLVVLTAGAVYAFTDALGATLFDDATGTLEPIAGQPAGIVGGAAGLPTGRLVAWTADATSMSIFIADGLIGSESVLGTDGTPNPVSVVTTDDGLVLFTAEPASGDHWLYAAGLLNGNPAAVLAEALPVAAGDQSWGTSAAADGSVLLSTFTSANQGALHSVRAGADTEPPEITEIATATGHRGHRTFLPGEVGNATFYVAPQASDPDKKVIGRLRSGAVEIYPESSSALAQGPVGASGVEPDGTRWLLVHGPSDLFVRLAAGQWEVSATAEAIELVGGTPETPVMTWWSMPSDRGEACLLPLAPGSCWQSPAERRLVSAIGLVGVGADAQVFGLAADATSGELGLWRGVGPAASGPAE